MTDINEFIKVAGIARLINKRYDNTKMILKTDPHAPKPVDTYEPSCRRTVRYYRTAEIIDYFSVRQPPFDNESAQRFIRRPLNFTSII